MQPNTQLRYGGYLVFRNLIPSPMLEAQAAEEFNQIAYGAEHANRLYGDTDAHVTRVRSIVDKMIPYSLKWNERAKDWKWDVAVVRSPDIRMYCLPGGKIVVYSGLLDRAHLNDNELGMLIGHEIAHALREHARERLGELQASQLDSSGTIPQLFGLADLGAAPLGIGSRLLEMKYESTDETEADVIGSDIASRAGFDPRAAVTLWDKLAHGDAQQSRSGLHLRAPVHAGAASGHHQALAGHAAALCEGDRQDRRCAAGLCRHGPPAPQTHRYASEARKPRRLRLARFLAARG